jgi:hypothetical protein
MSVFHQCNEIVFSVKPTCLGQKRHETKLWLSLLTGGRIPPLQSELTHKRIKDVQEGETEIRFQPNLETNKYKDIQNKVFREELIVYFPLIR